MVRLTLVFAVFVFLVAIYARGQAERVAMEMCQSTHSHDACFEALN